MSTSLEIVRIPVLNDNYVWLMREPQSGSVGVVDPAVAGPVLAEAAKRRWKITHAGRRSRRGVRRGAASQGRVPVTDIVFGARTSRSASGS
jgi:hydroxyacylglutathione hydrolase